LHRPIVAGTHRHYRARTFDHYLEIIEARSPARRLLDVGCAQGFFMQRAKQHGFQVSGVEPSPPMADFAEQELGFEILRGRFDQIDLGDRSWDVITFTDSLEYFADPRSGLAKAARHLAPGGLLFAKVPNGEYFRWRHALEKLLGRPVNAAEAFSPSRRIGHYSVASLRGLMAQVGLGLSTLEMGSVLPIDSPTWKRFTGLDLEIEPDWRTPGLFGRLMRRALYVASRAELAVTRQTRFAPSIYVLAGLR
jgi:SAM-dependent methyltransferase